MGAIDDHFQIVEPDRTVERALGLTNCYG
jgi:hypothetical protein